MLVIHTPCVYKVLGLIFIESYMCYLKASAGTDYCHVCTYLVQSYVTVRKAVLRHVFV